MAYVPRGAPKGKKSKEQFHAIDVDDIDVDSIDMAGLEIVAGATETVVDSTLDLTIKLPGHAATDLFTVEDDADHVRFSIAGDGTLVLPDNSIDNDMIADDAVDTAQIADDAVEAAQINDNAVAQAAMADDAIGVAELKVVQRNVTIPNLSAAGSVTNAADIGGIILGVYPESAVESGILDVTLSQVTGEITVTLGGAQNAGDGQVTVNVLQA